MQPAKRTEWRKGLVVGVTLVLLILCGGVQHATTAIEDTYEKLKLFTEILSLVQSNYVDEVNSKELMFGAVRGMLETLDPHSSFMPPEAFKEMQVETQGSFGGLGIEITVKDRLLTVVAPIEGTPADRAGLQPGDPNLRPPLSAGRLLSPPPIPVSTPTDRPGPSVRPLTWPLRERST